MKFATLAVALLATIATHSTQLRAAEFRDPSLSVMRDLIERFSTDEAALNRRYNISIAPERVERFQKFYEGQLQQLQAVDFDKLDQDGRIDYLLLQNHVRFELQQLSHEQKKNEGIASLIPFAPLIVELESARRGRNTIEAQAGAKALGQISEQIAKARSDTTQRLKDNGAKPEDVITANRAVRIVEELRQALKRWHDFHAEYDPQFTWWASQGYSKADKDLTDYATFLRGNDFKPKRTPAASDTIASDTDNDPIIGNPIGREALLDALRSEMIVYTPEELIEIANKEFAWCEAEYKRAAQELGFGDDWHKALTHVSALHVPPGQQPQLIRELAEEATKFVEDRDLVTVPPLCKEIWRMEMMSPERQRINPFFTGGEVISVSYPTAAMSLDEKLMSMRGNNRHFSRATVQHELIPGHHLQIYMSSRYRTHRSEFNTPFLVEGWALYWEMLLWDLNFPQSAEDRIGMLFWRSHRCARIIFSLKFHLGQMTPEEAIDFLVERVGHERRNATGEVRRSFASAYEPLYQAAYMLGGLQIRSLRKELVDTGKMSNREFHDAILLENSIPVDLIRASLTKQTLTRDYTPNWRFYDLTK